MSFRQIILKDGDSLSILVENTYSVADPALKWPGTTRAFRLVHNSYPWPALDLVPLTPARLLTGKEFRKEETPVPGTATLIHPYDFALLLRDLPLSACVEFSNRDRWQADDLVEIRGRLYYQTVRVPAQTKDIK